MQADGGEVREDSGETKELRRQTTQGSSGLFNVFRGSAEMGTKSLYTMVEKPVDLVDDECPGDDERK